MERSKDLLKMEVAIAYVLRGGVALSGLFIATGLALRIFKAGNSQAIVTGLLSGKALDGGLPSLGSWQPESIIAIGLLLLIALPIVRVAMTVFLFLKEKDYTYLTITLFVLVVLLVGVIFGKSI
jgi:uncharacterized membrane protein